MISPNGVTRFCSGLIAFSNSGLNEYLPGYAPNQPAGNPRQMDVSSHRHIELARPLPLLQLRIFLARPTRLINRILPGVLHHL